MKTLHSGVNKNETVLERIQREERRTNVLDTVIVIMVLIMVAAAATAVVMIANLIR